MFSLATDEAVTTLEPSLVYTAELTYDLCPLNSFSVLPDLMPCARAVKSNEPGTRLNLENRIGLNFPLPIPNPVGKNGNTLWRNIAQQSNRTIPLQLLPLPSCPACQ